MQLRAARAAEEQANYALISLVLVGATIALTLGTVVAGFLTIETMKNSAEKQLRAYVFVTPGNIMFKDGIPMRLHWTVMNTGETPAYKLVQFNSFRVLPYPLPPEFDPGEPDDGSGEATNVIAAKQTVKSNRPLGKKLAPELEALLRAGTHRWYMFAFVRYRDAFYGRSRFRRPKIRTTKVCASAPGEAFLAAMGGKENVDIEWEYDHRHNDAD